MNIDNMPDPSSELAMIKPGYVFRGIALKPASIGIRTLWQQAIINDSGDSNSNAFISWALVYLMTLDRVEAQNLAFNRNKFRTELLNWQDTFEAEHAANSANKEAIALFDKIWESWSESKIEVHGTEGATPNG